MPGFDAIGRLALGQGADAATTNSILVANAGAYSVTGVSVTFGAGEAAAGTSYAVTGVAAAFADKELASAASYTLTGISPSFGANESAAPGGYVLSGRATSFAGAEPAAAGAFALAGRAVAFAGALAPLSGAYILTGYATVDLVVMLADAGSYGLTLGPYQLSRSGFDYDFQQGGIGHYLEEIEQRRQLAKITRRTPAPVVHASAPRLRLLPATPAMAPAPAIDLQAMAARQCAAEQAQQAQQASILKRRRLEAEILLLAS